MTSPSLTCTVAAMVAPTFEHEVCQTAPTRNGDAAGVSFGHDDDGGDDDADDGVLEGDVIDNVEACHHRKSPDGACCGAMECFIS